MGGGSDGELRGTTATFLFDGTSRGGRGHESERRERGRVLACSPYGDGEGCGMQSFCGMK